MTATVETETIELARIRKNSSNLVLLFEAVRVAQDLGHDVSVYLTDDPIPPPDGEDREYDKKERERNSAVLIFFAETGER